MKPIRSLLDPYITSKSFSSRTVSGDAVAVRKNPPNIQTEPVKMNSKPIFQNGNTTINFGKRKVMNTSKII